MNTKVVIIGGGPRGLSAALYCSISGIPVTVIDPNPLHTWRPPSMVPDLVMRSPLTFDLTTGCEELQQYSLCNFMGITIPYTNNQRDIEYYHDFPSREDFIKYLDYVYRILLITPGVSFIHEEVVFISDSVVLTNKDRTVDCSHIIVASGNKYSEPRLPNWVALTQLNKRVVSTKSVIHSPPKGEMVAVVGSGQGSSELVHMLAQQGNFIYWCLNKPLRINQYPVPSYSTWGSKTALGHYYRLLRNPIDQMKYLREVKEWQPSITPRIADRLNENSLDVKIINPTSTNDLEPIFGKVSKIIVSAGTDPKLSLIPFKERPKFNPHFPDMPLLTKGFKSTIPNVYFTGLLALSYDGPRQGSLISAAITAKEIVNDIKN